ncbi:MAG: hypothetical protein Q8S41_09080 [Lutibacter sp.]|nr:hypothetical protein [Lutibacter sp.]
MKTVKENLGLPAFLVGVPRQLAGLPANWRVVLFAKSFFPFHYKKGYRCYH